MKRDTDARNPKLFKTKGPAVSTDITLRDLFAAVAMLGMVIRAGADLGWQFEDAKNAYRYADAMLQQREKEPEAWTV